MIETEKLEILLCRQPLSEYVKTSGQPSQNFVPLRIVAAYEHDIGIALRKLAEEAERLGATHVFGVSIEPKIPVRFRDNTTYMVCGDAYKKQ